jgi:hypothetical protein
MKRRGLSVVFATALSAACAALAQPTYVSGILHEPLGDAGFGTVDGRVLTVSSIGSSGQDGVEIRCRSVSGGGVGIDLTGFAGVGAPNREIKIRPKGWDGTIKGTMRAYNESATGEIMLAADFTHIGASESSYVEYDGFGNVVASGFLPAGGALAAPPCLGGYIIFYPSLTLISWGPPKQWSVTWKFYCSPCPDPWQWFAPCGGPSTERTIVVTPIVPGGLPGLGDLESLLVTGSDLPDLDGDGVPDLVVGNADVKTFPIPCPPWDCLGPDTALNNARWGLGQARISEECTPDGMGGCDETDRRLVVTNLGSSGQDGVAIVLPPGAGSVGAELAKGNCCRGHVIIMKLYDDDGHEQRVIRTQTFDPSGTEELDADFSSLGATGYRLTLYGASGQVLGPPGGTDFLSGGPKPVFTNFCPPGATEWWMNMGTPSNPIWVFQGCLGGYDFVLPGYGAVPNVASFRIEPLDALMSFGNRARCEIASDDTEGLVLDGLLITQAVTGDLNCDNVVNFGDINPFVLRLANPAAYHAAFPGCPDTNGDINGDGVVNFGDINPFVALLAGG